MGILKLQNPSDSENGEILQAQMCVLLDRNIVYVFNKIEICVHLFCSIIKGFVDFKLSMQHQ